MAVEMNVGQGFERYYADWLVQAEQHLASLRKALDQHHSDQDILLLVETCCKLYHDLARARIRVADKDPSCVSGGRWQTSYISGLLWLGSYRPTTATVLLFSLMGAQVKEFLPNLTAGREFQGDLLKLFEDFDIPALASLSNSQIKKVDSLQRELRDQEDKIDRSFAIEQMNVADQPLARATLAEPPPSESFDLSGIRDAIAPKLAVLRKLVAQAESLRSRALREIIDILTPVQAGQYTVATFEFAIALRKLGQQPQAAEASSIEQASYADESEELQALATQGDVDMLCKALQLGVNLSAAGFTGRAPLHAAALKGQRECVQLLIERGAEVNQKDIWGVTPLANALKGGHDEVARILADHGAAVRLEDPGLELCQAAAAGNWEYVKRLVQYGVDINSTDGAKQTALHIVAAHGSLEAVTMLLDLGANVLVRARNGNTPVDEARLWNKEGVQRCMEAQLQGESRCQTSWES
eukprot:TRINITY_DN17172_c0_g1_i1.p1 TRINITY_DN17172_c0_g1~~TRINITY_DN17172_c0_g1_i1.p1  ORF type:complete len:470 (+),score=88.21 TRINITY_DN17172_c0_g1_i1:192-1601(+)